MKIWAALTSLWLLLAPAPWGIALNHDTKECAGYWGGDEYVNHPLPEGWVDYYPGRYDLVETEIGTCTLSRPSAAEDIENCCQELGYRYVGENIGGTRVTPLIPLSLGLVLLPACGVCLALVLVLAFVAGGVLILRGRRRQRQTAARPEEPPAHDW
jgi:hypothetical protein